MIPDEDIERFERGLYVPGPKDSFVLAGIIQRLLAERELLVKEHEAGKPDLPIPDGFERWGEAWQAVEDFK